MGYLRNKIEACMAGRETGVLLRVFLYVLSLIYGFFVRVRIFLYKIGVLKQVRVGCKVISIGNITAGGSGKTPVTMKIAAFLKARGKKVVILSRGYKRKKTGLVVVSGFDGPLVGQEDAGDEAYLMAEKLMGVPVIVSADRVEAARHAIEEFSADAIVLDDGFQHLRLARDVNVVLIDGEKRFGTGYLLPRGVLREPLSGLSRADCFMVKGKGALLEIEGAGKPVFRFSYKPLMLRSLDGSERPLGFLRRKKVAIVSGIASPESFEATVKELGPTIDKVFIYSDHHSYSKEDVSEITAGVKGLDAVVTTEKDIVKLNGLWPKEILLLAISIEVEIENQEGFFELIGKG